MAASGVLIKYASVGNKNGEASRMHQQQVSRLMWPLQVTLRSYTLWAEIMSSGLSRIHLLKRLLAWKRVLTALGMPACTETLDLAFYIYSMTAKPHLLLKLKRTGWFLQTIGPSTEPASYQVSNMWQQWTKALRFYKQWDHPQSQHHIKLATCDNNEPKPLCCLLRGGGHIQPGGLWYCELTVSLTLFLTAPIKEAGSVIQR